MTAAPMETVDVVTARAATSVYLNQLVNYFFHYSIMWIIIETRVVQVQKRYKHVADFAALK